MARLPCHAVMVSGPVRLGKSHVLVPGTANPVPAPGSGRTSDRCALLLISPCCVLCLVCGSELPAEPLNRGRGMHVSRCREGRMLWHVSSCLLCRR